MCLIMVALNAAFATAGLAADAARVAVPLSTAEVKTSETTGGDLVADAILEAAKRVTAGEADIKPEVALVNAGQFVSGTVGPGRVTAAQIFGLLTNPDRKWVVSRISGTALKLAMERSLSRAPEASGNFLQVAGIRVEYDENAPAGHRVTSLAIGNTRSQPNRKYHVAMPEDLAKGGSGYFTVRGFALEESSDKSTIVVEPDSTLADAIDELIAQVPQASELDYSELDRIAKLKR